MTFNRCTSCTGKVHAITYLWYQVQVVENFKHWAKNTIRMLIPKMEKESLKSKFCTFFCNISSTLTIQFFIRDSTAEIVQREPIKPKDLLVDEDLQGKQGLHLVREVCVDVLLEDDTPGLQPVCHEVVPCARISRLLLYAVVCYARH